MYKDVQVYILEKYSYLMLFLYSLHSITMLLYNCLHFHQHFLKIIHFAETLQTIAGQSQGVT